MGREEEPCINQLSHGQDTIPDTCNLKGDFIWLIVSENSGALKAETWQKGMADKHT